MLRLYDYHLSGNGYKPRLLLAHLARSYQRIEVDILKGETRTPGVPRQEPPTVASRCSSWKTEPASPSPTRSSSTWRRGRGFSPSDRAGTGPHPAVDVLRAVQPRTLHRSRAPLASARRNDRRAARPASHPGWRAVAPRSRSWKRHLARSDWFGGEALSIADIALYAYTHVADEGGFELADYPAVGGWLGRIANQAGHVPMNPAPVGVVRPANG